MSRKVPGPPPGEVSTFVPEAFGNRDAPDPIEVDIRAPTERERRHLLLLTAAVHGSGADAYAQDPVWMRTAFALVAAVRRYTGADGKPIATGADLVESGETEIVFETMVAILAVVSPSTKQAQEDAEAEKKDSAKPSFSPATPPPSTPATHPSNGTATPADGAAQTSSAAAG